MLLKDPRESSWFIFIQEEYRDQINLLINPALGITSHFYGFFSHFRVFLIEILVYCGFLIINEDKISLGNINPSNVIYFKWIFINQQQRRASLEN